MALFEVNFFSEVLGMGMSMNVVIPQKTRGNIGVTEGDTGDRIPVLWLLHGMSDDHTTWLRRTSVERYAEEKGLGMQLHLAQTQDEADSCLDRTGLSQAELLSCHRLFSVPTTAAGCACMSESDR